MNGVIAAAAKRPRSKPEVPVVEELNASAPSATDKVTEAITRGIRAGTFVPGQHLLEPELTRRLNISRGSLREALKHLSAAGIVTLSRYRGAYIGILDRKSVLDLLDVLEPLARLAARLAAENCDTEEKRARILQAAESLELADKRGSRAAYLEQRKLFYDTMVDISGNKELARTMPLSRTDLFRAQLETVQNDQQRSRHASGYSKIAQGIVDRDAAAADRAVKRHFDGTRKTMEELPSSAFATFAED